MIILRYYFFLGRIGRIFPLEPSHYDKYLSDGEILRRHKPSLTLRVVKGVVVAFVFLLFLYTFIRFYYVYTESLKKISPIYPIFLDEPIYVYKGKSKKKVRSKKFLLIAGDYVITRKSARNVLGYKDKNNIRLCSFTQMQYRFQTLEAPVLALYSGQIWVDFPQDKCRIDTYRATVFCYGAKGGVKIRGDGTVDVMCLRGKMEVKSCAVSCNKVLLTPFQRVVVSVDNKLSPPEKISLSNLDAWQKWNVAFGYKALKRGPPPPFKGQMARRVILRRHTPSIPRRMKAIAEELRKKEESKSPFLTVKKFFIPKGYGNVERMSWKKAPPLKPPMPKVEGKEAPHPPSRSPREEEKSMTAKPVKVKKDVEDVEEEKFERESVGDMYYIHRDYIKKRVPREHPPGYGIDEKPVGPAER